MDPISRRPPRLWPIAALGYLALLAAAVMVLRDWDYALDLLGGALLLLLLVNIRNAWDLMLSMVRKHVEPA